MIYIFIITKIIWDYMTYDWLYEDTSLLYTPQVGYYTDRKQGKSFFLILSASNYHDIALFCIRCNVVLKTIMCASVVAVSQHYTWTNNGQIICIQISIYYFMNYYSIPFLYWVFFIFKPQHNLSLRAIYLG